MMSAAKALGADDLLQPAVVESPPSFLGGRVPAKRARGTAIKVQPETTPEKVTKPKDDNMVVAQDNVKAPADPHAIWWACPRCSYTLPESLTAALRNGRKTMHILGHGSTCQTATRANFNSRAKMLRAVWDGRLKYTPGKLLKKDLILNKKGRVVPKKRSAHSTRLAAENGWSEARRRWCRACNTIRKREGITGFMKLKRNGNALEKRLYMKVVECTTLELVANLNFSLQQMGSESQMIIAPAGSEPSASSDKQMKISQFASPSASAASGSAKQIKISQSASPSASAACAKLFERAKSPEVPVSEAAAVAHDEDTEKDMADEQSRTV